MSDAQLLDEVSENRPKEHAGRRSISKHWLVLGLLVLAHAAFGIGFGFFAQVADEDMETYRVYVFFIMLGFILSQPILLAMWAALAPQRFYHRFLWSLLLCILIAFAVALGTFIFETQELFFITMIDLALFIVAMLILLLVRRLSRWHIIHSYMAHVPSDYQPNQFGIKHLIILITITALACSFFRTFMMISPQLEYPSVAEFVKGLCEVSVMLLPIIIIPWFVLAYLKNMLSSIFYAIILLGIVEVAVYLIFCKYDSNPETIHSLFVQLGASISVLLTTLVIRSCGFRMIRGRKATTAMR
jgi:hypothetical protein